MSRQLIVVEYTRRLTEAEKVAIRQSASVDLQREIDEPYAQIDVVQPHSDKPGAARDAIAILQRQPNVKFAELDARYAEQ